jgi:hypothetical protein
VNLTSDYWFGKQWTIILCWLMWHHKQTTNLSTHKYLSNTYTLCCEMNSFIQKNLSMQCKESKAVSLSLIWSNSGKHVSVFVSRSHFPLALEGNRYHPLNTFCNCPGFQYSLPFVS